MQAARDLRLEWFSNAETIGITAGTSTPDKTIDEVESWVRDHICTEKGEPNLAA